MPEPKLEDIDGDAILGDGDDGGEEGGDFQEKKEILCSWSADPDEHRRVFVFDRMANSDIDGKILVENMNHVSQWLKDGSLPKATRSAFKGSKE